MSPAVHGRRGYDGPMKRLALALSLAALGGVAQEAGSVRNEEREPLEVTYLANEGVLVRVGERSLVIDAFVRVPYGSYAGLTPKAAASLEQGTGDFEGLDLALVSHVHPDHFQADFACRALERTDVPLVSSPQVVEALNERCKLTRIQELDPEVGTSASFEEEGIDVELFRLSHGAGRFASIQNLGHIVELGGWKLLHLGDATVSEAVFAPHDLAAEEIDVAFVPYWYFGNALGRKIVDERIRARHLVAVHVPPSEVHGLIDQLGEAGRDVHVFEEPLDVVAFP